MGKSKNFTLEWFKEFGWLNNPFRLEIFNPIQRYIAGLERERQKLNYFIIENFGYGSIRSEKGFGKTMLLLWLKQSLAAYKGSIVVDYYKAEQRGVSLSEQVVDNLTGIRDKIVIGSLFKLRLKKLFNRKKIPGQEDKSIYETLYKRNFRDFNDLLPFFEKKLKNQRFVLLIDDANLLSERDARFVQGLMDSQLPTQVILTLETGEKSPIEAKDVLKMKLGDLSFRDAKIFIGKRIESVGGNEVHPFNDHMLQNIYSKAKKNPLNMLKICYDQAVKLSLKHLSNRKKGIIPKAEKPPEFDELAEYQKLLAEEKRKHDPNSLILHANVEKEIKKERERMRLEEKKAEIPGTSSPEYRIKVISRDSATPIEIIGGEDSKYVIQEVNADQTRKKQAIKKSSRKKTRRKKSTQRRPTRKKAAKKSRKRSRRKR